MTVRGVGVPVTVDAEAGYGMPPAELAATRTGSGWFARPRRPTATRS